MAALLLAGCTAEGPDQAPPLESTARQSAARAAASPADYAAIVASTGRTEADMAADPLRKPADMLAFAGIRPGMSVVEMMPGGGYFSRLFAPALGSGGQLAFYVPEEMAGNRYAPLEGARKLQAALSGPALSGPALSVASYPLAGPVPADMAERFDVVWTSRNYHDFHNLPGFDGRAANAMVMDLLKPGGVYVVLDHSAPDGSGASATDTTHRIDADLVRREVESAGFLYDGSSAVLKNAEDDRTGSVYSGPMKGRTDQFVMRFRKPG
ncbi:methyltransferase [Croceicoccus sp. BE223]|uniref:class I SAM-dependent methyltransferase n=1 Tax=Croceicoccus sp. BE223 TaxID=2817716 RepID=UPI002857E6E8|nr:methyltransferase [Croceicoccus sp. BE223]MDR7102532.1 putative methyltransferase [Croceicoccus sp. BE223]